MIFVVALIRRFNRYYAARPILTTMLTNAILGGVADTVAQSLTAINRRSKRLENLNDDEPTPGFIQLESFSNKKDAAKINGTYVDDDDVDFVLPGPDSRFKPAAAPAPFDFERLTRFIAYGFLMAPIQHRWFSFLSTTFPITVASKNRLGFTTGGATGHFGGMSQALKRVAMDQLIMAPIGTFSLTLRIKARLLTRGIRSRTLLHLHDRRRRWWPSRRHPQIPRSLRSRFKGQLYGLAFCADPQLSSYSFTVSNSVCEHSGYCLDSILEHDEFGGYGIDGIIWRMKKEKRKEHLGSNAHFGILNWFFGSEFCLFMH
jgi:hypothetical protein